MKSSKNPTDAARGHLGSSTRSKAHWGARITVAALLVWASQPSFAATEGRCTSSSPTVTIGLSQRSFSYLPTVLAQAKGFYCEEGLNVVNSTISDAAAPPAAVSGGIDYIVNVANVAAAVASGLDLRMIAMVTSKPFFVLITPANVHSIAELKGVHIAITSPGSSTASYLTAILAASGLSPKDVDMQPLGNAQTMLAALLSHQVQAAMIYPPFDVEAVKRGYIRLANSKEFTNVPLNTLVTSGSTLRQKPEQVKKVLAGTLRALQYIQNDRQGTIEVMQKNFGIAPDLVSEMYDAYKDIFSSDGTISDVQAQAIIHDTRARLPNAANLATAKLIDTSLLTLVQKQMGIK